MKINKNFIFLRDSKEYKDFWIFLKKYQSLVARRAPSKSLSSFNFNDSKYSKKFNHPLKYDKRWRFNFLYKLNKQNAYGSTYDLHGSELYSINKYLSVKNFYNLFKGIRPE